MSEPEGPSEAAPAGEPRIPRAALVVAYLVVAVAGLIVLRATVDALDFLGIGWILVLAALPLLPWLLPRLRDFVKEISPYLQSVKLGALQLDLRGIRRDPISIPSSGVLGLVPNDTGALSSDTAINGLLSALREFRRAGAGPVVVIDLRDGRKWRLPNLYFLARLLEVEPVVSQLVFTEARGGDDGYAVGSCRPDELRRHIERTVPAYASAAGAVELQEVQTLAEPMRSRTLATAFQQLLGRLPPQTGADDDPAHGYVTSGQIRTGNLRGLVSPAAVEAVGATLSEEDVRTVLESPHRFVPATAAGRLVDLIDREAVALAVARAVLTSSAS